MIFFWKYNGIHLKIEDRSLYLPGRLSSSSGSSLSVGWLRLYPAGKWWRRAAATVWPVHKIHRFLSPGEFGQHFYTSLSWCLILSWRMFSLPRRHCTVCKHHIELVPFHPKGAGARTRGCLPQVMVANRTGIVPAFLTIWSFLVTPLMDPSELEPQEKKLLEDTFNGLISPKISINSVFKTG